MRLFCTVSSLIDGSVLLGVHVVWILPVGASRTHWAAAAFIFLICVPCRVLCLPPTAARPGYYSLSWDWELACCRVSAR